MPWLCFLPFSFTHNKPRDLVTFTMYYQMNNYSGEIDFFFIKLSMSSYKTTEMNTGLM